MIEMLTAIPQGKPSPSEPKYLQLLAYMDSFNLPEKNRGSQVLLSGGARLKVNMGAGVDGTMRGTSWGGPGTTENSAAGRVIQHLCPSEEVYNRQKAEGRFVFLYVSFGSRAQLDTTLSGLNRNGYSSSTATVAKGVIYVRYDAKPSLVYYDSVTDELYSMQGSAQTGPTVWSVP